MAEGGAGYVPRFKRSTSIIRSLSVDDEVVSDKKTEVDHAKNLVTYLGKIRRDDEYIDVTLNVGGTRIKGHKVILAAFSPYFRALLRYGAGNELQSEVALHDLNGAVVEKLVDFAYTGKITYTNDSVQELLETANFLDITQVRHECAMFISKQLDSQNFTEIYLLGRQLGEEIMFKTAIRYCLQNFTMISKTQEFLTMSVDMFEDILKCEDLEYYDPNIVPIGPNLEAGVLSVVLRYVGHDRESRLPLLPQLLSLIRMPSLLLSTLTALKENDLVKESPLSVSLVDKAIGIRGKTTDAAQVNMNTDLWSKPRSNKSLVETKSGIFAGGHSHRPGFVTIERYDDLCEVPPEAYVTGMKLWSRRWDGRQVLGGYQIRYSDGTTLKHGATDLNYEIYEFKLDEGEAILSIVLNSGWCIDQLTFHTSKGRVLGPFGGEGGGQRSTGHDSRDRLGGYLAGTSGYVAESQEEKVIVDLQFTWKCWKAKGPALPSGLDSDEDSGEFDDRDEFDEMY